MKLQAKLAKLVSAGIAVVCNGTAVSQDRGVKMLTLSRTLATASAILICAMTASAANAIEYVGTLVAGKATAKFTITTNGKIGKLDANDILNYAGVIKNETDTVSFATADDYDMSLTGLFATETQIILDPSKGGYLYFGTFENNNQNLICIAASNFGCSDKSTGKPTMR